MKRKICALGIIFAMITSFSVTVTAAGEYKSESLLYADGTVPQSYFSDLFTDSAPPSSSLNSMSSEIDTIECDYTDHLDYLTCELQKYENADSFFEKYYITHSLRNYIYENEVDIDPSFECAELIAINEVHLIELMSQEAKYDQMLKNNASIFIQGCNELKTKNDYLSIKKICDDISFYFFHMDVSVKGVRSAIDVYEDSKARLIDLEIKSETFIRSVDTLLKSLHGRNVLYFIISAKSCSLEADVGIDGVAEALEALDRVMSDYNASIAPFNNELSETRKYASGLSNHSSANGFSSFIEVRE